MACIVIKKKCVRGARDLSSAKDINREREREREGAKEPVPPLPADKSAIKTRGCKNVMAKS